MQVGAHDAATNFCSWFSKIWSSCNDSLTPWFDDWGFAGPLAFLFIGVLLVFWAALSMHRDSKAKRGILATLLNGATTTGDGPVFDILLQPFIMSVQAVISGSPATCVINVMASLDSMTWDTVMVLDVTEGYISGEIQTISFPIVAKQIKGNVGAISSGASVSLYMAGQRNK